MKPIRTKPVLPLPFLALAFALAASAVQAASFVVWPGQSLQAAIDAAAAGDNITVQTGTYNENITITKGIDIRGTGGAVLVTGTLTITNPVLPVYLADIAWGKAGATGMTFTGTASQNVRLDRCKLVNGGNLSSTGLNSYFYKNEFSGNVSFTSAVWTMQRCTMTGNLQSTNSTTKCIASIVGGSFVHNGAQAGEATVFQSDLRQLSEITLPSGKKAWVAYSTLNHLFLTGGTVEIVGNLVTSTNRGDYHVNVGGNCVATIRNNVIFAGERWYWVYVNTQSTAIRVRNDANLTRILNNSISDISRGIEVQGAPVGVEVRGNIHRDSGGAQYSLSTGSAGTIVTNNNFQHAVSGGVQSNNINQDPGFITSPNGQIFWLAATSPSRDAGPEDALFNDLDGSRNDQGAYGGHSYDPTGRTTLKPVVLSGDVSPLYVKRGGAVTITARAAVAAAP
jgi:hypothetical protein